MDVLGFDWNSQSYPAIEDLRFIPLFVAFFLFARFLLDRFAFEYLARRFNIGEGDTDEHDRAKKFRKFKESAWKFVHFLSAEIVSLSVLYNEPWFTNTRFFWLGPEDQIWPDQKIKLKLKASYMYSGGFYVYSILALLFWETRRKDFGVSMFHHVVSVVLIVSSYMLRFARVGSVVLAIHDVSDVFLETGKMSKYTHTEWLASIAFALFALQWFVLRLIYFPFWILRSTSSSYEAIKALKELKWGPIYYYVFNSLLISLLLMNVYWWVVIFWMLIDQIKARGRVSDDARSDSEDKEDQHEN